MNTPQPWRPPPEAGFRTGLSAYRRALRDSGQSELSVSWSTGSVLLKVLGNGLRGLTLMARFGSAASVPFVGRSTRLRNLHRVRLGRRVRIDDGVDIQGQSRLGIRIGDNVTVGAFTTIRPSDDYGRLLGVGLTIGPRTSLGPSCYIGCAGGVTIGSDVLFGPNVSMSAEAHNHDDRDIGIKLQGIVARPIVVEDDCWIGGGVIILGGVTIGRGAIVGAGSVVTKDVPPGAVAVGNPAVVIRTR